jgi:hypothetical protein
LDEICKESRKRKFKMTALKQQYEYNVMKNIL